jgi:xylulokinase
LEYGVYSGTLSRLFGSGVIQKVLVTGGGEKSAVWNQIKADILGVPIVQVMGAGGAAMGSALLAGYGEGTLRDIEDTASRWIHTGTVTGPDAQRSEMSRRRVERYATLLETINRWSAGPETG